MTTQAQLREALDAAHRVVIKALKDGAYSDSQIETLDEALRTSDLSTDASLYTQLLHDREACFNDRARPTYLKGVRVEVVGPAPTRRDPKLYIKLHDDAPPRALDRFGSRAVSCPVSILSPVS